MPAMGMEIRHAHIMSDYVRSKSGKSIFECQLQDIAGLHPYGWGREDPVIGEEIGIRSGDVYLCCPGFYQGAAHHIAIPQERHHRRVP